MREHPVKFSKEMGPNVLQCVCGDYYLHHGTVKVYERLGEDADIIKTTVGDADTSVEFVRHADCIGDTPSIRRSGLTIEFWCESCTDIRELCIAQHKGITYFYWRDTGRQREDQPGFTAD